MKKRVASMLKRISQVDVNETYQDPRVRLVMYQRTYQSLKREFKSWPKAKQLMFRKENHV